jgi:3-oxoadipate enol-lactonase
MLSPGTRPVGYDLHGAGSPVVLLHPFPFDRRIWTPLTDTLARRHRVIAVDGRGFGETPLGDDNTIAEQADDLAALLDHLDVPRAAVLGMSMGGYTALAFAARHPARLAALVLCDTRAGADDVKTKAARDEIIARLRAFGSGPYLDGSLARLLSPKAPPACVAFLREALRDRPDRSGELGAIRCPTLALRGTDDQVVPADDMQAMAAAIPGATFMAIPEAGHLAHVDAPAAFERALTPFLAAVLKGVSS